MKGALRSAIKAVARRLDYYLAEIAVNCQELRSFRYENHLVNPATLF